MPRAVLSFYLGAEIWCRSGSIRLLTLTLKGLICSGFGAQRPYYIRLWGHFDA